MENASYAKVRLESAPYSTRFGIGKWMCARCSLHHALVANSQRKEP
ncbi:unnamed protein product [Ectocarpus sp. 8 AP-2014]